VAIVRVPEDGDDLTMTDDPDELIAGRLWVARVPGCSPRSSVRATSNRDPRGPLAPAT
jgi:hypothetical protein